jgi:2-methylcitrate dehydratase PrpD
MEASTKPFSASGANIPAMQAAYELRTAADVAADDIADVRVVLSEERRGRDAYFEGAHDRSDATPENAKGSLRFRIAAIMLDGRIDTDRIDTFRDAEVRAMLGKVRLEYEPSHTSRVGHLDVPSTTYGRVEITTRKGATFTAERDRYMAPRGDWDAWIRRSGDGRVPQRRLDRLVEMVTNLEHLDDTADLMKATRPASKRGC